MCKASQHPGWSITDAEGKVIAHIPQCLRDHTGGVGKVEHFCIWVGVLAYQFAIFCKSWNTSHGKGKTGGTCRFLPKYIVGQGNALITDTHIIFPSTDRCDDVIGALDCFNRIGRQGEVETRHNANCNLTGQSTKYIQLLHIVVHENNVRDIVFLGVLGKAFCQHQRTHTAATDNSQFHCDNPFWILVIRFVHSEHAIDCKYDDNSKQDKHGTQCVTVTVVIFLKCNFVYV